MGLLNNEETHMQVQELHDLVAGMHQGYYDRGGPKTQIEMMLALVVDGRLAFLQIDAGSRDEWYAAAAAAVRLSRASAYCAVSEAWMATARHAGDPVAALAPSKRTDRQEVVTTVCVDRAGERASSVKAIRRDPATARVVALVDLEGVDMSDGDLFHLFDR
jgi:hypothetical protein